jgi:hypothetical protein
MSDESNKVRNKHDWSPAAWTAFLVLVIYPLSFGPIVRLAVVAGVPKVIYAYVPVIWATCWWQPAKQMLDWYLHLWGLA